MNNFRIIDDCGGRVKEMRWGRCKTEQTRITNGMVQYNAGWMHSGRTNHISSMYAQKIITIQGTKQTNAQDVTVHTHTRNHKVIHFTAKQTKAREYAGCAIMLPTEDANFIQTIGFTEDRELRGRVGYIRLSRYSRCIYQ